MPKFSADIELDCEGLLCPLPVLKARKALLTMAPGQVLAVIASDGMAAIDLPHFCNQTGHSYLGSEPGAGPKLTLHYLRAEEITARSEESIK